jgi:hypothetical protein
MTDASIYDPARLSMAVYLLPEMPVESEFACCRELCNVGYRVRARFHAYGRTESRLWLCAPWVSCPEYPTFTLIVFCSFIETRMHTQKSKNQ